MVAWCFSGHWKAAVRTRWSCWSGVGSMVCRSSAARCRPRLRAVGSSTPSATGGGCSTGRGHRAPRRLSEHLAPVPVDVRRCWWCGARLGSGQGLAGEAEEPVVEAGAAAEMLGDEDRAVVGEGYGAAIEGFVVERAEGEAVVFGVGASCGVPFEVCGFEGEIGASELAVPTADRAAVLVVGLAAD